MNKLLANMAPMLDPQTYVFATTTQPQAYADLPAIMRFAEAEGETLILAKAIADEAGFARTETYSRITLSVHSALDAVGFLAAICSALAAEGISTNAVAAYHHDHIFVPRRRAQDAIDVLERLFTSARE